MATCPTCRKAFAGATFCPKDGSRLIDETMDGSVVLDNRYRLIRQVGAGGMGEVYEAEHIHIHRKVVVKVLKPEIASDTQAIARLKQEAQTTSGLGHPNIVDTLDFGTADGQSYLVMEWLEGESLDARLSRGPIDIATALDIAAQTASGLAEAHAHGVIHRDIKPANLFLTTDRNGGMRVKVVDFGIAKLAASQSSLTATGVLIGTPSYMAPEQAMGEPIDERTDIYALGVILYEMVTGLPPFRAETPLAVLHQHTSKAPVPPSESRADRGITVEVEAIVLRCLAKRPDQRFASMGELVRAIDDVRGQPAPTTRPVVSRPSPDFDFDDDQAPPRRRRTGALLALAAVVVVAIAVTIVIFARGNRETPPTRDASSGVASQVPDAGVAVDTVAAAVVADAAAVLDAATLADAAGASDAAVLAWRHEGRGRQFAFVAVSAKPPVQGEPFTVTVTLDELSDALAAKPLRARVSLEYFRDHSVVYREIHDIHDRALTATLTMVRPGKHHVRFELLDGDQRVDIARFDLVFAAP